MDPHARVKTVSANEEPCLDPFTGHQRDVHGIFGLLERHDLCARRDDAGPNCLEQEGVEPRAMERNQRSTHFLVDVGEIDLGSQRPPASIENGGALDHHAGPHHELAKSKRLKGLHSIRR
jgi:hypothetical protein